MDVSGLLALTALELRLLLPGLLSALIAVPEAAARNRRWMEESLEGITDEALLTLTRSLAGLGDEQRLYPADPTARFVTRVWVRDLLVDPVVEGIDALASSVGRGPTAILCNHLSYVDTTATDALLSWKGRTDLADRLAAVAGPKVYADVFRRVAAAGLCTIPAPQSAALEGTARLNPRELARQALSSMRVAHEAMARGHIVVIYPEGSRSRNGRLRPFLKAVHRYLEVPELQVVPTAISGTDEVFPVDATRLSPAKVRLRFGAPLAVDPEDPRRTLEAAHQAVAALLPEGYRPETDAPAVV